jgi:tetratricopeptide (TPR) repeat protein
MRTHVRTSGLIAIMALVMLAAFVPHAHAQAARQALADGRAAYRKMEYDTARVRLRRGLDAARESQEADSTVAALHAYLGASAMQLGRVEEAREEFVAAVSRRPDYRMDTLEFPVAVSRLFDLARSSTAFIGVSTTPDTTLSVGADRQRFTLVASAPHEIRVDVVDSAGARRRIYAGAIGERLEVFWDGLDAERGRPMVGTAELQVRSTAGAPRPMLVRIPLRISSLGGAPMSTSQGSGGRASAAPGSVASTSAARTSRLDAMAAGLYVAAIAAVIPALASERERGSTLRFVVSGAALGAALGGMRRGARPTPAPAPAPSQAPRAARLRIQSGPATRSDQ